MNKKTTGIWEVSGTSIVPWQMYVLHVHVCAKPAPNTRVMMYHASHVTTPLSQKW